MLFTENFLERSKNIFGLQLLLQFSKLIFLQINCCFFSLFLSLSPSFSVSCSAPTTKNQKTVDTLDYMPNPKRSMDMDTNGFYGDTFNSGFGGFETTKRNTHHDQVVQDMLREQAIPIHRCAAVRVF
jgi:hypothetical protein